MNSVRSIINDLVEKRLWPVALLLICALVAVPMLVKGGGDAGTADPAAVVAPAADEAARPAVVELQAPPSVSNREGKLRDPFRKAKRPPVKTDAAPATRATATPNVAVPTGPASPVDEPTERSPAAPAPKVQPKAKKKPAGKYDTSLTVNLRFGQTGKAGAINGVDQLSPLPSADDPFFVFEGVLSGTRTARFLVADDAKATGDGKCLPSPTDCREIDLRVGQTEYFDLDDGSGQTIQYQLDVVSVGRAAKAARVRASRSVYRTRVRFGASAATRARGIKRLQALGGTADPAVQYLGVGSDRNSAVFVLGPNTRLLSRNACLDGTACRSIALAGGNVATVEVQPAGKPWRRYRLEVMRVVREVRHTRRSAIRGRRAAAGNGRGVMRRLIGDVKTAHALKRFTYSPRSGLVSRKAGYR